MGFIVMVLTNTVICICSLYIISTAEICQFPQWSSFFEIGVSSPRGSIYLNRLPWLEDRYFTTSLTLRPVYWHYEHGSFTPFTLVYQSQCLC